MAWALLTRAGASARREDVARFGFEKAFELRRVSACTRCVRPGDTHDLEQKDNRTCLFSPAGPALVLSCCASRHGGVACAVAEWRSLNMRGRAVAKMCATC